MPKMMPALKSLDHYAAYWLDSPNRLADLRHTTAERERSSVTRMRQGIAEDTIAFDRGGKDGHFTASAAIIDPAAQKLLLTHHRKLGIWVQLGGHCDGDTDLVAASKREGLEESGLTGLAFAQPLEPVAGATAPLPLDLDIHSIPDKSGAHDHYHFDVRYLWLADSTAPLAISDESLDLAWVPFSELKHYSAEDSVLVLAEKAGQWLALECRP